MSPIPVERMIFIPAGQPCSLFPHEMKLIARRSGCEYTRCECGARKVVIQPGARCEPSWITQGTLSGQVVEMRQATIFEMRRAA